MKPDTESAARFLAALDSDDFVYQTFDDDETRKDDDLAITTRATSRLVSLQNKRAGVFVTINKVKGNRRLAANVVEIRAIFADFDQPGTMPTEWGDYEPSIIVESSPDKHHVYWVVEGEFPVEEFKPAQRALAARFGSDPKVIDPSRVMRLPGYWHQKAEPFQTRIVEMTGQVYSYQTLKAWLGFEADKAPERTKFERTDFSTDNPYLKAGIARSLDAISNAKEGSRNHTLNSEAFGLFGFVKGGHLGEVEARAMLNDAALSAGLVPGEIQATLNSAWTAARPRDLPAPRGYVPVRYEPDQAEPEYESDGSMIDVRESEAPEDQRVEEPVDRPGYEFKCLGYNKEFYYYLPRGKGQVVTLKAGEHTKLRLLELASLNHWAKTAGGTLSKGSWDEFANSLMRESERSGIFDDSSIRGRGAWVDGKQIIVHTGSEAHIGDKTVPLDHIKSRFIYEAQAPWQFGFGDEANSPEAHRLVEICERLTWADKLSGALMVGWCVIAPVSGALKWRSHIWVTGPSGSGKTTAIDVINRIVGPSAERADGKTTEAAIRQKMGYDARPVIMDEVESEDQSAVQRVQGLLDLARVSSSGGTISKGGANHRSVNFIIRSCFCFSSINTAVRYRADESRVSKLVLVPNAAQDREQHYQSLIRDIDAWFDENYASRMFTRTIKNLPSLLKNCNTFTTAAAIVFNSRRAADQLGPMLAGYYLCHSTKEITLDGALDFIKRHNWLDYVALDAETDDSRLFQFIISRTIKVALSHNTVEMTIGSAIEEARSETSSKGAYSTALGARGIKVDGDYIGISDSAENTRALFKEKPEWSADWKGPLRNIPGAIKSKDPERFVGGIKSRLTWIPYEHLTGTYRPREPGED